jgi:hypothetical protein
VTEDERATVPPPDGTKPDVLVQLGSLERAKASWLSTQSPEDTQRVVDAYEANGFAGAISALAYAQSELWDACVRLASRRERDLETAYYAVRDQVVGLRAEVTAMRAEAQDRDDREDRILGELARITSLCESQAARIEDLSSALERREARDRSRRPTPIGLPREEGE